MSSDSNQIPTSVVVELNSCFNDIPEVSRAPLESKSVECFAVLDQAILGIREKLKEKLSKIVALRRLPSTQVPENLPQFRQKAQEPVAERSALEAITRFASAGTIGVVDPGASQTVIGSKQVPELLSNLSPCSKPS